MEEGSGNIRVVIKVRPPNQRELALPGGVIVDVMDDFKQVVSSLSAHQIPCIFALGVINLCFIEQVVTGRPPFSFDVAFPTATNQLETFERIGVDIVATAYHGYNASMFAYGQTSSGKSFSMMGVRGTPLVGLIPRIANLFFYCVSKSPSAEFLIEGSYLEICMWQSCSCFV